METVGSFEDRNRAGKRDRSDIVKLGGPADVRAIFNRARHFGNGKRDRSDIETGRSRRRPSDLQPGEAF